MEEIKVGDYVRTKQGHIFKAKSVYEDMIWYCDLSWIPAENIIKHSPNIIDLIEVGDYVNGKLVKSIPLTKCVDSCRKGIWRIANCTNEDIKTIVTKEQFAEMEYEV